MREKNNSIMIISNTKWSIKNFRTNLITYGVERFDVSAAYFKEEKELELYPNINSHHFDTLPSNIALRTDIPAIINLLKHFFFNSYSMVYVFTTKALLISCLPLLITRTPFIYTITGFGRFSKNGVPSLFASYFYRIILRNAEKIVCQNKVSYSWCMRYFANTKVEIIKGSGVQCPEVRERKTKLSKKIKLIYGGRFSVEKGIVDLVKRVASSNLHLPRPIKIELHIYPARLEDYRLFELFLIEFSASSNVNIILHEPSKTFIHSLENYDALLLPSDYGEGIPKTLLEGLSVGIPVFVSEALNALMWDDIQECLHVINFKSDFLVMAIKDTLSNREAVKHKAILGQVLILENCTEEIVAKKYLNLT